MCRFCAFLQESCTKLDLCAVWCLLLGYGLHKKGIATMILPIIVSTSPWISPFLSLKLFIHLCYPILFFGEGETHVEEPNWMIALKREPEAENVDNDLQDAID